MPITIETFKSLTKDSREANINERIILFLKQHQLNAYSSWELAKELDISDISLRPSLRRLKINHIVDFELIGRTYYYAYKNAEEKENIKRGK